MQRLKSSILVVVLAFAALAQTASEKPSVDVRRVGSRLACQCVVQAGTQLVVTIPPQHFLGH